MVADPRRLAVHINDKLAHIMMLCCCDGFGEHGAVATPFCRRPRILRLRKGFASLRRSKDNDYNGQNIIAHLAMATEVAS